MRIEDAFRAAYRRHLVDTLPGGDLAAQPDRGRALVGPSWARYARAGWVERAADGLDVWTLTDEGRSLVRSVQLSAGRPAEPDTVARRLARERAAREARALARIIDLCGMVDSAALARALVSERPNLVAAIVDSLA